MVHVNLALLIVGGLWLACVTFVIGVLFGASTVALEDPWDAALAEFTK